VITLKCVIIWTK